jgi:hypothetical protein
MLSWLQNFSMGFRGAAEASAGTTAYDDGDKK